jgi:hypothetical protein
MANGKWQMANGKRQMPNDKWQSLSVGCGKVRPAFGHFEAK